MIVVNRYYTIFLFYFISISSLRNFMAVTISPFLIIDLYIGYAKLLHKYVTRELIHKQSFEGA